MLKEVRNYVQEDISFKNLFKGPLIIWFVHRRTYDVLFITLPSFKNIMKIFKIFYLSFSFHNMQIDTFAFLLLILIIMQLENALNSLIPTLQNQSIILCES